MCLLQFSPLSNLLLYSFVSPCFTIVNNCMVNNDVEKKFNDLCLFRKEKKEQSIFERVKHVSSVGGNHFGCRK